MDFYGVAPEIQPELEPPPLPEGVSELWRTFLHLSAARGHTGMTPVPLQFSEIEAYCRLHHVQLSSWELETLQALDAAWFVDHVEHVKASKESGHASR